MRRASRARSRTPGAIAAVALMLSLPVGGALAGCELFVEFDRDLLVTGTPCASSAECDDGNACTSDVCGPDGLCATEPEPDGPVGAQEPEDCLRTECQAGQLVDVLDLTDTLDDFNACTDDSCDPSGGGPISTPLPYETPCNEGAGTGRCGCLHGEVVEDCLATETPACHIACTPETAGEVCDDDNSCTVDSCNASTSLCAREQLDGVPAPEEAQVPGDCRIILCTAGVPSIEPGEVDNTDLPDDDSSCTEDRCTDGAASNAPLAVDTACTDDGGHFCDGAGACVECNDHAQCGNTAANCLCRQCVDQACVDLASGTEAPSCQTANDCQILECNGAGSYTSVDDDADLPVTDNNICTDDLCTVGAVEYRNNTSACDDDLYCNGTDTCSGGTCGVHAGDPCAANLGDDDSDCSEACNEASNNCTGNDPANSACNDGAYCTVTDRCNSTGSCVGTGNPCPGADGDSNCSESCSETNDNCVAADPNGVACNDGAYCNGTDSCSGGTCSTHAGNPCPGADGDNDCSETCNETADDCTSNDPNGSACTDGTYCNGLDSCLNGACSTHAGDPCGPASDSNCGACSETNDACNANEPNGSACSDGAYCNGTETCTGGACGSSTGDPCAALLAACSSGDTADHCHEGCSESNDNCTAVSPAGTVCHSGSICNDACDGAGVCIPQ